MLRAIMRMRKDLLTASIFFALYSVLVIKAVHSEIAKSTSYIVFRKQYVQGASPDSYPEYTILYYYSGNRLQKVLKQRTINDIAKRYDFADNKPDNQSFLDDAQEDFKDWCCIQ